MRAAVPSAISSLKACAPLSSASNFTKEHPLNSEDLVQLCAGILDDKKAEDIIALDLRGISSFTDFFVIASGTSEPHLRALINELEGRLKKDHGVKAMAIDGFPMSQWVVADFSDVVVHIFSQDKRDFYGLEDLWSDAPRLALKLPAAEKK